MKEHGFVFLDDMISDIRWDAKYSTWDNFTGKPVDGYGVNRIVGTYELSRALLKAKKEAAKQGYGLLLWDSYRPQVAVDCFLKWSEQSEEGYTKSKFYPNINRKDMISQGYVAPKSGHSRGSAIDLTLYNLKTGELLDMGTDFDFMDTKSHHDAVDISNEAVKNRLILKSIMENCGFQSYQYEWWHYLLENEPYPNSYFNFPII